MFLNTHSQANTAIFSTLLTVARRFLVARINAFRQWGLTLSILNTETQWQQILASWQDIQTGKVVSATQAFSDLALLEESEDILNG